MICASWHCYVTLLSPRTNLQTFFPSWSFSSPEFIAGSLVHGWLGTPHSQQESHWDPGHDKRRLIGLPLDTLRFHSDYWSQAPLLGKAVSVRKGFVMQSRHAGPLSWSSPRPRHSRAPGSEAEDMDEVRNEWPRKWRNCITHSPVYPKLIRINH